MVWSLKFLGMVYKAVRLSSVKFLQRVNAASKYHFQHTRTAATDKVEKFERFSQGSPWSWKVMEFRKTIFQAWKVMENSKGHGKSWKMMIMSWNFYYCTEQFCISDTTSFIKSNYEPFYLFNSGTTSTTNSGIHS